MSEKKELKTRRLGTGMGWEIYMEGGGPVPKELDGLYTSDGVALNAIKMFQAKVQARANGKG